MRNHPACNRWLTALGLVWCALASAGRARAQTSFTQASVPTARENGWSIFGATSSLGYSTFTVPSNGPLGQVGPPQRENDYDATMSISAGYSYVAPRTSFSMIYMPTLVRRVRYSNLHTLNQAISLSLTRTLSHRWDLRLSGSAMNSSADQLMFVPAVVGIAPVPANGLDDLLGGARAGQETTNQLASALTSTPYIVSPSKSVLYGTRYLNSVASLGVGYRPSVRLQVGINLSTGRSETTDGLQQALPSLSNQIIPRLLSQQAGISVNYSLTPRTAFGGEVDSSHIDSSIGRYYVQSARASFNHSLTPSWDISVRGGPAYVIRTSQPVFLALTQGGSTRPSYSLQASVAYTNREHSLSGAYGVSPTDTSGFNSQRSDTATLRWEWQPAGRLWAFDMNAGHQSMVGGILGDVQYWQGRANLVRFIGPQLAVTFTYAYVGRPAMISNVVGGSQDLSGFSGRISVVWTPRRQGRNGSGGGESGGTGQGVTARRASS